MMNTLLAVTKRRRNFIRLRRAVETEHQRLLKRIAVPQEFANHAQRYELLYHEIVRIYEADCKAAKYE